MTQGREAFLSTLNPQLYTIPATFPRHRRGRSLSARIFLGCFWAFGLWVRTAWADFFHFCLLHFYSAQKVKSLIYNIIVFFYTLFLGFWA